MDNQSEDIFFYYFNSHLITNLKKIVYDEYFKSINYDYTQSSKPINDFFTPYKVAVYTGDSMSTLTGDFHTDSSLKFTYFKHDDLGLDLSPTYRLLYTYKNDSIFDYFTFDYSLYITRKTNVKSKLHFSKWAPLLPSAMLNVCQKTLSNSFYYTLLGYESISNSVYNDFTAPVTNFDSAGDLSAVVVCSLRLINSNYKYYCCGIANETDKTTIINIKFNHNTGMVSYSEIDKYLKRGGVWRVLHIYNQMEDTPSVYFTASYQNAPTLTYTLKQQIRIYSLDWSKDSYMVLTNDINVSKVNDPYFTIYTNINFNSSVVNNIKLFSSNDIAVSVTNNTINAYNKQNGVKGSINNLSDGFHTLSISSSPLLPIRCSDNSYEQKVVTTEKLSDKTFNHVGKPTWMYNTNTSSTINISMSEIIIFVTDNINVSSNNLDDISNDSYSIWTNSFKLINPDLRCNNTVPVACEIDRKNPICACYPSYNDEDVKLLLNNLDKTSFSNTDKWCINPICASRMAYKNPISKNSSVCSSICSSSLHANTQKYGNLSIKNTQVMSLCDNQSSRSDYTTPCGAQSDDGSICAFNNTSQKWGYVNNTSCTLKCDDNYQCIIYDGDKQKCIPIDKSTKKCTNSTECGVDDYCNTSAGVCFPNPTKSSFNILIAFVIFISVILSGLLFFIFYKKYKKSGTGKKNIWFFVLVFIISIIAVVLYYIITNNKVEGFIDTICKTDSQCSKDNSRCSNGKCECNIGYNNTTCLLDENKICVNFPYLPISTTSGTYYYITKMSNGNIYAFGLESNFKYNGEKWQEVNKLPTQKGFSPYRSFIETDFNINCTSNTNMCVTYKDSVFIFVPVYSQMSKTNTHSSYLLKFEDVNNAWSYEYNLGDFFSNISVSYNNLTNNIVTIIVNDKLYIFGGIYISKDKDGNITEGVINQRVGIYDILNKEFKIRNLSPDSSNTRYKNLRFYNYSKAFVSKDNEIYLIGVENISDSDKKPYIYKYILSNETTVNFKKIGECPTLSNQNINNPNNGGILCYYHMYDNKEYITILSHNITSSKIAWRIELDTNKPGQYISMYTPTNQQNIINQTELIGALFVENHVSISYITYAMCYFEMNGLLFIITGCGDIMRCNNYQQDIADKMNIVPCYGVELYEEPLYNKKRCMESGKTPPDGWKWSDTLCGYYKLKYANVKPDCVGNENCPYGSCTTSCVGNCDAKNQCANGWKTESSGACFAKTPCRYFCKLENVKKDFYYCDRNTKKWKKSLANKYVGDTWDATDITQNGNTTNCLTNIPSELGSYCTDPSS